MIKIKNDIKLVVSDFDGIFTDGGVYVMVSVVCKVG